MRNSSDIFCLKEAKAGENDGSMMFSVNGSRSVRINRKSGGANDGFQYGSNFPSDGDTFKSHSEILKTDSKELTEDHSKKPLEEDLSVEESPRYEEDGQDAEPKTSRSSDEVNKFIKLERNQNEANASSMKRNILTGAGMEVQDNTSMKKKINNTWTR
ncbi:hypothetical protein HHI36_000165 [Cryptolaemus montrouzieri]|uniref:Uncharacterized protein n=1 Tax=Cryptolaemus montrouzieri TaxID=559131 RepID=A0ABD2P443_9CUCU